MNNLQTNTQTLSFWNFFLEHQAFHVLITATCGAFLGFFLYAIALSFDSEASLLAHIATGMAMTYMFDTQLLKISVSKQTRLLEKHDPKQFFYAFEREQQKLFSMPIFGWFWYKKTPAFFQKFEERCQELRPLKLLEKLEAMEKTPDNLEKFLGTVSEIVELSGLEYGDELFEILQDYIGKGSSLQKAAKSDCKNNKHGLLNVLCEVFFFTHPDESINETIDDMRYVDKCGKHKFYIHVVGMEAKLRECILQDRAARKEAKLKISRIKAMLTCLMNNDTSSLLTILESE